MLLCLSSSVLQISIESNIKYLPKCSRQLGFPLSQNLNTRKYSSSINRTHVKQHNQIFLAIFSSFYVCVPLQRLKKVSNIIFCACMLCSEQIGLVRKLRPICVEL